MRASHPVGVTQSPDNIFRVKFSPYPHPPRGTAFNYNHRKQENNNGPFSPPRLPLKGAAMSPKIGRSWVRPIFHQKGRRPGNFPALFFPPNFFPGQWGEGPAFKGQNKKSSPPPHPLFPENDSGFPHEAGCLAPGPTSPGRVPPPGKNQWGVRMGGGKYFSYFYSAVALGCAVLSLMGPGAKCPQLAKFGGGFPPGPLFRPERLLFSPTPAPADLVLPSRPNKPFCFFFFFCFGCIFLLFPPPGRGGIAGEMAKVIPAQALRRGKGVAKLVAL